MPRLPQSAIICYPAETSKFDLFAQLPKKGLDFALLCHYNWRAALFNKFGQLPQIILTSLCLARIIPGWARGPAQRPHVCEKILPSPAKDLTLVAFARILAQVTPIESKLHFATGAPAPKLP